MKYKKMFYFLFFLIPLISASLWAGESTLTSDRYNHEKPQWSPDGNWIVYHKKDGTTYHQIYKVPSAGGDEIALTSDSYDHWSSPQWSPDGNWIVYHKSLGNAQICKVPSEGGDEIVLTSDSYNHRSPQWSPDGNWIVYSKWDLTTYCQIYKVSATGGDEISLTSDSRYHEKPQWSPDGNWIVYEKYEAYDHIYKIASAGGDEFPLTSDSYHHGYPQWSPDGNWIVYTKSDTTGHSQIYKVPSAGGAETALTSDSYGHHDPQWSPDGNQIVYFRLTIFYQQIYKVSAAGGAETALTNDTDDHCYPQWSPDGNWIVYQKKDTRDYWQIYKISSEGIEEIPSPFPKFCILKVKPTLGFSSGITIEYSIIREGNVSLQIYDVAGKLVKELVNKELLPGNYTITWDGTNHEGEKVSSGNYFVRLEASPVKSGKFSRTEKVIVIR